MSRVLLVSMEEGQVVARCLAADVGISAIERLPTGGVRLVCMSGDGAEVMRKKFKSALIKTPVTRELHRPGSPPL